MKKILSLFIVGFLLVGCSETEKNKNSKKENKTDLEKDGFSGKVKSITTTHFNVKEAFGETQKTLYDKNNRWQIFLYYGR